MRIKALPGWRRARPSGAYITWLSPKNDTPRVEVRVLPAPLDDATQWKTLVDEARSRPGYNQLSDTSEENPGRRQRVLRYTMTEADQKQFALLILVTTAGPGVVLRMSGQWSEQGMIEQALASLIAGIGYLPAQAVPKDK
jgi:hypothetical protein